MNSIVSSEFFDAIALIEQEKGIPQSLMIDKIKQAIISALKKDNPTIADYAVVDVDTAQKEVSVYAPYEVVEEVEDPARQMELDEARRINRRAQIGDVVRQEIQTKDFGRIAAQNAKQVIIQGIREAERSMVYDEFTSKEHEILTGTISRIDYRSGDVTVEVGSGSDVTEAVLMASERSKGEVLKEGDRIKVYVVEVKRPQRGPQVILSRTHPGLVKRLFELEVPEIFEGVVEIRSIAREAGSRTKLAVISNDAEVDPIGACVGSRGARVAAIVNELHGEKIDIVNYSEDAEKYVAAALSPAEVISVTLMEDGKSCRVIVPDDQLSLAIGKEGQNARLAAKLTGYKIDIKSAARAEAEVSEESV